MIPAGIRIEGERSDPRGLAMQLVSYLGHMAERDYANKTIQTHAYHLRRFSRWCLDRGLKYPQEITRKMLENYQGYIFRLKTEKGQPLSESWRLSYLFSLRSFFRWLMKRGQLLADPAADLELPKRRVPLPKNIFSRSEIEQVLNSADLSLPAGLRDRTMMEVLYSTGIRRMELCNLKVLDVDIERGWVLVDQGKGRKDRIVPIGERALLWLEKYMRELRPIFLLDPSEEKVFLTRTGRPILPVHLSWIIRRHIARSGLDKPGACHAFRHSMATLMLEGGADIRYIQEMLGHSSLDSTQIYTKVAITQLKEVHARTHPGAKLK